MLYGEAKPIETNEKIAYILKIKTIQASVAKFEIHDVKIINQKVESP